MVQVSQEKEGVLQSYRNVHICMYVFTTISCVTLSRQSADSTGRSDENETSLADTFSPQLF